MIKFNREATIEDTKVLNNRGDQIGTTDLHVNREADDVVIWFNCNGINAKIALQVQEFYATADFMANGTVMVS